MISAPQTREVAGSSARTIFLKDRRDLEYQSQRRLLSGLDLSIKVSDAVDKANKVNNYSHKSNRSAGNDACPKPSDEEILFPPIPLYFGQESASQCLEALSQIRDILYTIVSDLSRSTTAPTRLRCFSRPRIEKLIESLFGIISSVSQSKQTQSCEVYRQQTEADLNLLYLAIINIYYLMELELYFVRAPDVDLFLLVLNQVVQVEDKYKALNVLVYETIIQLIANSISTKDISHKLVQQILNGFCPIIFEMCKNIPTGSIPATFIYRTNSFWFLSNAALVYTKKDTELDNPTYQTCLQLLPLVVEILLYLFNISTPLWFDEVQIRGLVEGTHESWIDHKNALKGLEPNLELFYLNKQLIYLAWAMTFFCDAENVRAREYICRNVYAHTHIMDVLLNAIYDLPITYAAGVVHILIKSLGSILNALSNEDLDVILSRNLLHAFLNVVTTLLDGDMEASNSSAMHVVAGIFWICSNLATTHAHVFICSDLVSYFILGLQSSILLFCRNSFLAIHNILYHLSLQDQSEFLDRHEDNLWNACASVVKRSMNMKWSHRNYILPHCIFIFATILAYDPSIYVEKFELVTEDLAELQCRDLLDDATSDEVSRLLLAYK